MQPRGWDVDRPVWAVDADHRVEVHKPPALVLGHLGVGQPSVVGEVPDADAEGGGEGAAEGFGEAVPQWSGVGLPQHLRSAVQMSV